MVIKASSAAEVRTLIAHLESPDPGVREGAAARLRIIGSRAVDRLTELYTRTSDTTVRVSALQALEGIGDPRALRIARAALAEGGEPGVAAAAVLRALLPSRDAAAATGALDALIAAALDARADRRTRVAAVEALRDCPPAVRGPIESALANLEPAALGSTRADEPGSTAAWEDALDGRLPARASTLHALVSARAPATPLTALLRLIETVRSREADAPDSQAWMALRGSLHHALALRGSRVALYDLVESVERARGALPASFLGALQTLGDASSLEAIATAWARADDPQWRERLGLAFAAVARREHVTARHAVAKRIAAKWPAAASLVRPAPQGAVSKPSRTRPRRMTAGRTARRSR
jgi:HEAT repeat protein